MIIINKLDKIGFYDKETGEELEKELVISVIKEAKDNYYKGLEIKYRNGLISRYELVELMKYKKISSKPEISYDRFYMVNMNKSKPDNITDNEYGKFFRVLNYLEKE